MPRRVLRPDISGLLDAQLGLVRRDQVVGIALTDGALAWLLRSRRWRMVLPSIYATSPAPLTEFQRLVAAHLYGGPRSLITGPAALRAHGLRSAPGDPRVHLLLPHRRHLSSAGFAVIIRTSRPETRPVDQDTHRLASVARAIGDSARAGADLRTVRAVVTEAVQRGLEGVDRLSAEVDEGRRNGSGILRQVVDEVAAGVRSAPEAEFKDIVDTIAEIPEVVYNPALRTRTGERLPTPDAWIPDVGLAIEIDSREYHSGPAGWTRTLDRHNALTEHDILVMHFTPAEIRTTPDAVRARLIKAYRSRLRDAPPVMIMASPKQ